MLPQEASMAKLAATELAKRCALEGVQIMGGYGYATEYPMERYLRSAVVTTIYGGTSEIQKNIIAKTLGLWRDALWGTKASSRALRQPTDGYGEPAPRRPGGNVRPEQPARFGGAGEAMHAGYPACWEVRSTPAVRAPSRTFS